MNCDLFDVYFRTGLHSENPDSKKDDSLIPVPTMGLKPFFYGDVP